jgi:hypothetical protein
VGPRTFTGFTPFGPACLNWTLTTLLDFMKAPGIIWPVLLAITGLTCWLTIPQPPQARIRIEPDVISDVSASRATTNISSYDPYFAHENSFPKILITASKPK